ncbi:stage II sporulation protein D [Cytobacillus sp. IB215316]|uniref:stage II sporulation protein D n=1 Tax=Cytobacillus sp. IB215316 TaxID=3097354 RepID=UPI002A0F4311|nr:stage II sporulation protein D [Cytobacillus sp. IB215316]MDX8361093.1 stage II sporulation protein D [Cytobacillus sp. IB215316]
MKQVKPLVILISVLFAMIIVIPSLLVFPFSAKEGGKLIEESKLEPSPTLTTNTLNSEVEVAVYRSQAKTIEHVPLEEYVVGVLASEMPADFELEALKAQSLSARTYIVKKMIGGQAVGVPEGADVTDMVLHQVYKNKDELKELWGIDYERKMEKFQEAVRSTAGQILTYDSTPIEASFFSTSNGFTENSEDYWENPFPYLTSVASPWDETSPKFHNQVTMTVAEFEQKLNIKLPSDGTVGKIIARTPGKRVDTVEISGKTFKGREVRDQLGLSSSDFTWVRKNDQIVISTKGYGHGVGMSQYGANGMAEEGKTYQEILTHYYKGAQISDATPYLTNFIVKN